MEAQTAAGVWMEGYEALTAGCALVKAVGTDQISICGEDARRFVNGLVTCDVPEIKSGETAYGFMTNAQGRILADVVISASEECLVLDLPLGRAAAIDEHMLKYRVADRVETRLVEARLQIIVAGPRADSVLSDVLERSLPEAPHLVEADGVALRREHRLGVGAWSLRGEATDLETISHRLEDAGAVPAALEAVTAVRIERGVAWFGVDFGEENFPQETGLEKQALSYSKGCYLGQEIVARIHYRGHVNRHVRGLLAPSSVRLQAGQELALGGEKVGAVASATWSPAMNASIGLAMLHRKAEPEAGVALASGELLRVVPLPFV